MRGIGIALLAIGCVLGVYAYQMDTTVTTEAKDFGFGITIPATRVNNIGLMEERKNKLMIAGVLAVVGAIFTAIGGKPKENDANTVVNSALVKCTYCAELIQPDAMICRYCGRDVPPESTDANYLMKKYGITKNADSKYRYDTFDYDSLDDAVRYAKFVESRKVA